MDEPDRPNKTQEEWMDDPNNRKIINYEEQKKRCELNYLELICSMSIP